ncbi:MAG TPA: hypothetical protein EYP03_00365 [Aquificae bacterium]|nr:hypothetical protein [Aquificota bacterium]
MADENAKNNNQSQEDLAKAWEEALAEQNQSQETSQSTQGTSQNEEDIMKMWQDAMGNSSTDETTSAIEVPSSTSEAQEKY